MTDPEDGGLVPRVVKTRDGISAAGTIYSQHIVDYVRENEVAALFGDAQADPRLTPARSVLHQSICASMCAPLIARASAWFRMATSPSEGGSPSINATKTR